MERLKTFNPGDIIDYRVARIPHFYPVYDIGYVRKIDTLFTRINQIENIICIGRLGLCSYNNINFFVVNIIKYNRSYPVFLAHKPKGPSI